MINDLQSTLESLHDKYRALNTGTVATYIPELAKADPDLFCISVRLIDGTEFTVGNSEAAFTLQSCSKPLALAQALATVGRELVMSLTGVEPTGNSYASIVGLDQIGKPLNPMVNAGAIVTASLLGGTSPEDRFERLTSGLSAFTGSPMQVDQAVYESEQRTSDRNRALAYLLKSKGTIEGNVEQHLDLYIKQCAMRTNTRQIAIAAATLANNGLNPVTKERAISAEYIKDILVVMLMNGMYNYAGRWAYEVGIPAKSGVSGAMMGVVPGVMGIAVYSPRLDEYGNSTRGLAVCRDLVRKYHMHIFDQRSPS
ncbi:MAG: glutaminase A [Phycisphaerae bacterium]|nr:glutaminase A [Phycisphaerae bacterium]MBM90217.1 glutaminase A [Phycisphaerae bacterium]HCT45586.1 glutaminase A [Phycisphaerales bacterium]|tara:strand:- start:208 stop:1143 length:936 start_codon:yes stop_codon:yes gene_type:complete